MSLFVLAACATAEPEPVESPEAPAESTVATETEAAEAAPEALESAPEPVEAAEATELANLPEEPEIDDDPEQLIGLGTQGLAALLGEPELIRREAPAQVWQYRSFDCVFDVFLYRKEQGDSVTYVEARDTQGNKTEARSCLNELLRARQAS